MANIPGSISRPDVEPSNLVVVLVKIRVKTESQQEILTKLLATTEGWLREPGCLDGTVLCHPTDTTHFMVLETFASAQALQVHEALPSTREFLSQLQPHLAEPPSRTTWRPASRSDAQRPRQQAHQQNDQERLP